MGQPHMDTISITKVGLAWQTVWDIGRANGVSLLYLLPSATLIPFFILRYVDLCVCETCVQSYGMIFDGFYSVVIL